MNLQIIQLCLPLLIGYVLFVGFSGQFVPFLKPNDADRRPRWFLGLWTFGNVSLVLGLSVLVAYELPLDAATKLLLPTLALCIALEIPGILGFVLYRRDVAYASAVAQQLNSVAARMDKAVTAALNSIDVIDEFNEYDKVDWLIARNNLEQPKPRRIPTLKKVRVTVDLPHAQAS